MGCKQLSFTNQGKERNLLLRQLKVSNFKNFHGTQALSLNKGINIIMPDTFNEYEIEESLEFDDIYNVDSELNNAKEFYFKNMLEIMLILKGRRNFDDLGDLSYFAKKSDFSNDKDMIIESIFEEEQNFYSKIKGIKRRSKYRNKEWFYKTENELAKWKKQKDIREYANENKEILDSLSVYFKNVSVPLLYNDREVSSININFPNLKIQRLVDDINSIFIEHAGKEVIRVDKRKIKRTESAIVNDDLFKLGTLIAMERQIKSKIVILSPEFLSGLYDDRLEIGLEILKEFNLEKQQIIVFYNNIFYIENHRKVRYWVEFYKKMNLPYTISGLTEDYKTIEEWQNTTIKQSARRLCYMQDLEFDKKVELAKDIIKRAFERVPAQNYCISESFGKDSMVMFTLINEVIEENNLPKIKIAFIDTKVEFSEHIAFAKEQTKVMEEMGYEVHWTKPKTTFWKVVEEYGFPIFGKAIRPSSNPTLYKKLNKLDIKYCGNTCCDKLKKEPYKELYDGLNIDLAFVGTLASESNDRRQSYYRNYKSNVKRDDLYKKYGEIYYVKTEGRYKALPLIHFSEDDIWKYIKKYNVPTSPLYDIGYWKKDEKTGEEEYITYSRTGCYTCSMNIQHNGNNIEMLRHTHPHLWELLMIKKGLAKELYKFKHDISEKSWNENEDITENLMNKYLEAKPCHLDKA